MCSARIPMRDVCALNAGVRQPGKGKEKIAEEEARGKLFWGELLGLGQALSVGPLVASKPRASHGGGEAPAATPVGVAQVRTKKKQLRGVKNMGGIHTSQVGS